jgi:cytochrome c biogenesis protein CcdA
MDSFLFDIGLALWLGILTSITPCPLATNIAAISFIGRQLDNQKFVFLAGIVYMLGRTLAYTVLGAFLVASAQAIPAVAMFLQKYMAVIIGPLLIVVGIILLGVIKFTFKGGGVSEKTQKFVEKTGLLGAGVLGIIFALSFCPPSAAIFFGNIFSIAMRHNSRFLIPGVYGIGTALPVIVFAFLVAFATNMVGKAFNKLTVIEKWVRKITAIIFIIAGIYLCLENIFHVF